MPGIASKSPPTGEQVRILLAAAENVNKVLEAPAVLRELVAAGMKLTGTHGGMAGLMADGRMVFQEYNRDGELIPIDYTFPAGYGVPGWIVSNREPYVANDAEHDPHDNRNRYLDPDSDRNIHAERDLYHNRNRYRDPDRN